MSYIVDGKDYGDELGYVLSPEHLKKYGVKHESK